MVMTDILCTSLKANIKDSIRWILAGLKKPVSYNQAVGHAVRAYQAFSSSNRVSHFFMHSPEYGIGISEPHCYQKENVA